MTILSEIGCLCPAGKASIQDDPFLGHPFFDRHARPPGRTMRAQAGYGDQDHAHACLHLCHRRGVLHHHPCAAGTSVYTDTAIFGRNRSCCRLFALVALPPRASPRATLLAGRTVARPARCARSAARAAALKRSRSPDVGLPSARPRRASNT